MTELRFNGVSKQTNVTLDDFRQMVNYDNTKNKGYVRMALGNDGNVVIQKVNNKIDCPLAFRFNMGKDNNIALRDLFSRSFGADLKYMDSYHSEQIKRMITSPQNKSGKVDGGAALARLDVRAIFEKFDAQFNTPEGRNSILEKFFSQARELLQVPSDVSKDEFLKSYLRLEENGLGNYKDYLAVKEGKIKADAKVGGKDQINTHEQMVKSENDFRRLICALEGRLESAKHFVSLTNNAQGLAIGLLKSSDGRLTLTDDDMGKIRSDLVHIRHELGLDSFDNGGAIGTSGNVTELFMKTILPAMLRSGVEVIQTTGEKSDSETLQAVKDNFSKDELVQMYQDFLIGAKEAFENEEGPTCTLAMCQKVIDNVNNLDITDLLKKTELLLHQFTAADQDTTQMLKGAVIKNAKTNEGMARINRFALKFLTDHFKGQVEKSVKVDTRSTVITMNDDIMKMVTAAQIQFGTRVMVPGQKLLRNQMNTDTYIHKMGSEILPTVCNKVKGGTYVYEKLMTHTLSAMINQVVSDATRDTQELSKVIYDTIPLEQQQQQLETMASAYMKFREDDKLLHKMVNSTIRSFEKLTQSLVKKGKINESSCGEASAVMNKLKLRMDDVINRLTDAYFDQTLKGKEEGDYIKQLTDLFNAEKKELVDELNTQLNNAIMGHLPGNRAAEKLLNTRQNLIDSLARIKQDEKYALTLAQCEDDIRPTMERMYNLRLNQALKDAKIKNDFDLPKDFADKFTAGFDAEVKKLLDAYNKFSQKLDTQIETMLTKTLKEMIDGEMGEWKGYKNLTSDELKAFTKEFVSDVMVGLKPRRQEILKDYLANPERFAKGRDLDSAIEWQLGMDTSAKGINGVYHDVIFNRRFNIETWTEINFKESTTSKIMEKKTLDDRISLRGVENLNTLEKSYFDNKQETLDKLGDKTKQKGLERQEKIELCWNEKDVLSHLTASTMISRLNNFGIMYGRVKQTEENKQACLERIRKECDMDIQKNFDAYMKLRDEFLKKTWEARNVTYSALTSNYVQSMLEHFLQIHFVEKFPQIDMEAQVKDFIGMLEETKNQRIADKMQVAAEAEERITKAFNLTRDTFEQTLLDGETRLREVGANDADIAYFKEVIVPKLKDDFAIELNTKTNRYLGEEAVKNAKQHGEWNVDLIVDMFNKINLNSVEGIHNLIAECGITLGKELVKRMQKDTTTANILYNAIKTWANLPENVEMLNKTRRAYMAHAVFDTLETNKVVEEANEAINGLSDNLRENLLGYMTEIRISSLNKNKMPLAQELFKSWIDQYNFPKTTFARTGAKNAQVTMEQAAMELFAEHTNTLMNSIHNNPSAKNDKKLQLLDQDFMNKFLDLVNRQGMEVMLNEVSTEFIQKKIAEKMGEKGSDMYFFNPLAPNIDGPEMVKTAKILNYHSLVSLINKNTINASNEVKKLFPTVESLARWREQVMNIYEENVKHMDAIWESSKSRVELIEHLAQMDTEENKKRLVKEAVTEHFTVDLQKHDFKRKFDKLGVTPMQFLNSLTEIVVSKDGIFDQFKKNMIDYATNMQNIGVIFPRNESEGRNLDVLFKMQITAEIKTMALTQTSMYYKTINAMMDELGLKK